MTKEKEFSTEYIKHTFSEDEKREISEAMALQVTEQKQLEGDKKAAVADFTGRIEGIRAQVQSAAVKVNNGYEYKNVKCEVERDYDRKVIRYIRTDNGELGKEKPMTSDDLQMKLETSDG